LKIQGVPKIQLHTSADVTFETEVTVLSGTFQKLHLVLKFPFKPPDGIPFVHRCLETLPVIMDWAWWTDSLAVTIA
jgi:hypothetical protein